ncbi:hypothetical protein M426DRAFT_28403 [Hypoxylon sp. CI-4A]|nr:hypothetical protein M426DRAFT_28403 [Hypoxylon sp. CI-4A]
MAPSGPRKGSAPSGPRNNRNSTNNGSKTVSRGGVTKRRGNTGTKVDRDGDLDMDGPTGGNRNRKAKQGGHNGGADAIPAAPRSARPAASGSRPPRSAAKTQQIIQRVLTNGMSGGPRAPKGTLQINALNTMNLQVEGLMSSKAANNEGGGLKELLTFLERKAQTISKITRPIRIKKSHINGDFVYITTSKEDGEEILKVNGFAFAGTTLTITEVPGDLVPSNQHGISSSALEVQNQLHAVLSSRYDPNTKLLNLSTLGEDPGLNQMGLFNGESTPEKLFRALMVVCDRLFKTPEEKREAVISVSLAGNNIDDVHQIMTLNETFPDLVNLDLSGNHFKDVKGLQKWRHRFQKLETLLLNGNPIEMANPNYKEEIMAWFPKLQNLSGIQVRTPEQIAAMVAASRPTPIPQHGPDFRDINGVGENFIKEFLPMYDGDRHNLAAKYYDNESTFSIAVNNKATGWGAYIKFSRNLVKITHTSTRIQRLFFGTNLIQGIWQQLPPTRHPDLLTEFNKYIIDCHPVHGLADPSGQSQLGVDGMIITIHGQFEDQEPVSMKTAMRSFSRTFVLGPGAPGRNPIRVVSDMLTLRDFSPIPTLASEPPPQPTVGVQQQQQEQMVIELCKRTGMTPDYSRLCLDGASWNFDQALIMFNEKRAQLPPDAFVAVPQ